MPQSNAGINAMHEYWAKKRLAKVKRLVKGKPKWKSEIYMTPAEYEAYIKLYLDLEEGVERPTLDQAKIAKDVMALKMKNSKGDSNPLLEEE